MSSVEFFDCIETPVAKPELVAPIQNMASWSSNKRSLDLPVERDKLFSMLEQFKLDTLIGGVTDQKMKAAFFLTSLKPEAFDKVKDLLAPCSIIEADFDQIESALLERYTDKKSVFVYHKELFRMRRRDGERIEDFADRIRGKVKRSDWPEEMWDNVTCHFLHTGLNDENLDARILDKMKKYDLKGMIKVIKDYESVRAKPEVNVLVVDVTCSRCLSKHPPERCYYIDKQCNCCKEIGHIVRACPKVPKKPTNKILDSGLSCFTQSQDSSYFITVPALVNGQKLYMLVDTCASCTLLPLEFAKAINLELRPSERRLVGFGREIVVTPQEATVKIDVCGSSIHA